MEGTQQITQEAINKAFSIVDEAIALVKGEQLQSVSKDGEVGKQEGNKDGDKDVIVKGKEVDYDSDEVKKAIELATFLQKGGMAKEAGCEYLTKGGFSVEVAQASWEKALSAMQAQQDGGTITSLEVPLMKAEEVTAIVSQEVSKSLEPVNGSLNKVNEAIKKGFEGFGTLIKSVQEQNALLTESNKNLAERLEAIEKTPNQRKSATGTAFVEKFVKSEDGKPDSNTYDITKQDDLNRLGDTLMIEHGKAIEKGDKDGAALIEGTINSIEASKHVPQFSYKRLAQLGIKLVAP